MGLLEPADKHAEELRALLLKVVEEGGTSLEVPKEYGFFRRAQDPANSIWYRAVVDGDGCVVGYLSGVPRSLAGGENQPKGGCRAHVQWVVIEPTRRGQGYAKRAIAEFAELVCGSDPDTLVSLRLDTKGDVEKRRNHFASMGFHFDGEFGTARLKTLRDPADGQ